MRRELKINQLCFLKALQAMKTVPPAVDEEVAREHFEKAFLTHKKEICRHDSQAGKQCFDLELASTD